MTLSQLSADQICSHLFRAGSLNISHSWFGNPQITLRSNGTTFEEPLSQLEEKTVGLIRNKHLVDTPEKLIEIAYLVNRCSEMQKLSKEGIETENCISQIFYKAKEFIAKLFKKFAIFPNNDIDVFMSSYLAMPLHLARQNQFTTRFPTNMTDSSSGEPLYTPEQAASIYFQLHLRS
jgi:hypothetical protein